MQVSEIAPRLWRWTAFHEEWKEDVGSVFCDTEDGVVLVDPIVPAGDESTRFFEALDRDVRGRQVHVLITVFWHVRSAPLIVERYDARVWAPTRGRGAIERRVGLVTDTYRPGDSLPGGIEARPTARASEVVFWVAEHRSLVPGDVLLGDGDGGLKLCPASWLPEKATLTGLAETLQPLLDLPVERVLVSHGEPVLRGAGRALAAALASVE